MFDVKEISGIYLLNFCNLFYTDFSPLAKYRKLWMRSAVSGSSTHHAIICHGVRFFPWPTGRMVTGTRPCHGYKGRASYEFIKTLRFNGRASYGSSF